MSFESPEMAKDFPGLYRPQGSGGERDFVDEDKPVKKKDVLARRRDSKPERRGKGYRMFEEEDSEEELVAEDNTKSPSKMKKHSKPSFKFPKRDKLYKAKDKDKDRDFHLPHHRERDKSAGAGGDKDRGDGGGGGGSHKEAKKKDDKIKWRKKKLLGPAGTTTNASVNVSVNVVKAAEPRVPDPPEVKPVFGVTLTTSVERSRCHDGIQLPVIFRECVDYIEEFGLSCEGIYRISGVKSKVQSLKDAYNQGHHVFLHEHEPNIVASLLKLFLRELPEPVLTKELMPKFEEASTNKNVKQKVELFQQLIEQLPVPNKLLLSWMIVHMTHVIAKEKQNKMSLQNVSIVLSPTMQISHRVLNVLFTYSRILFKDTVLKRHVPPLKPVTSHWSLDLPESPSALEEELQKQESLLNQLHGEVAKKKDPHKEEQLWEVQRFVTQLKRKIKMMKKSGAQPDQTQGVPQEEASTSQPVLPSPPQTVTLNKQNAHPEQTTHAAGDQVDSRLTDKRSHADEKNEKMDFSLKQPENGGILKPEILIPNKVVIDQNQQNIIQNDKERQVNGGWSVESSKEPLAKPEDEKIQFEEFRQSSTPEVTEGGEVRDDNEATPEVESPLPSSDTLEQELDQEDAEDTPHLEALPLDQAPVTTAPVTTVPVTTAPVPTAPITTAPTGPATEDQPDFFSGVHFMSGQQGVLQAPEQFQPFGCMAQEPQPVQTEDPAPTEVKPADLPTAEEKTLLPADADFDTLNHIHNELQLEEEELHAMSDELKQKIETERSEIERLHQEIADLKTIREDFYDSDEASTSSSDDDEDEEELKETLKQLLAENAELEVQNKDLSAKVHEERQICLSVKVQIRMIQQRQLESSGGMLLMDGISESDALIQSLL